MAETTVNAYATTGSNTAAGSPTPVAVVNDGTGDRQVVAIGASDGSSTLISSTPTQGLNVHPDSTTVFYEDWSNWAIDIVGNWNPVQASLSGSSIPTLGSEALATGATANSYAYITSQATFQPVAPGFLEVNHSIKLSTLVNHAYAFFGNATPNSSPTSTTYAIDGYGFEMSAAETLYAVCWASGTRNQIASLSIPSDGLLHKYQIYMRGDNIYWAIDYAQVASISTGALGPNNNYLPVMILVGNDSTGSSGFTLTSDSVYIGDSTKDSIVLQDALYPQYETRVTPAGQLQVIDTVAGASLAKIATGIQFLAQQAITATTTPVSLVDSFGNAINSTNGALSVAQTTQRILYIESAVLVGTSVVPILPAGAVTRYLTLVNDSNATIYVSLAGNSGLVTGYGIRLNALGGSFTASAPGDELPISPIYAIATAASSNLLIQYA
jgi:hypothetical protein